MSSSLKKMIKKSKKELSEMIEESDLNNNDRFITALLNIEPKEPINIPNDKLQQILNEEGIYTIEELLSLTISEAWSDELGENKKDKQKLKRIKKKIIGITAT